MIRNEMPLGPILPSIESVKKYCLAVDTLELKHSGFLQCPWCSQIGTVEWCVLCNGTNKIYKSIHDTK